jgi:hypothetical protein
MIGWLAVGLAFAGIVSFMGHPWFLLGFLFCIVILTLGEMVEHREE